MASVLSRKLGEGSFSCQRWRRKRACWV